MQSTRRNRTGSAPARALKALVGVQTALVVFGSSALAGSAEDRAAAIEASPQWSDGVFRNTIIRRDWSYWNMFRDMLDAPEHTAPLDPVPVVERTGAEFTAAPASGLRVTWFGQSSVLVEIGGKRVLTDPVWSERASPFSWAGPKRFYAPPLPLDQLPPLDAVVISHDHYDHLDEATIKALADRTALFAVPLGVGAYLEEWGIAPEKIVERDWWGEITLGELTLTAVPARHFSGRSTLMLDAMATLWAGWVIASAEHRIYYSGDTAMFPGFLDIGARLGPFDLTLLDTGAYNAEWADVHLGPEQAVQAHRMARGKLLLPGHWAAFDLANHGWTEPAERVLAAAAQAGVRVVIPQPGTSFEPSDPPAIERWWPELPWQTAEEAPVVSSGLEGLDLEPPALSRAGAANGLSPEAVTAPVNAAVDE